VTELPPLTWLYAPASRPELVAKALASRAHAVIVDLEDAVAPAAKQAARDALAGLLPNAPEKPVSVRVNPLSSPFGQADLDAVARLPQLDRIHLPKVETAADVEAVLEALGAAELPVHCLIESARGVEEAFTIAQVERVVGMSLGESDLRAELGVCVEEGLDWARSRIVNAAVAAGLPRPPQSVYPHRDDDEGLARSCERGRALGHLGRAAIHPRQLPVIEQCYLPDPEDVLGARQLLARWADAERASVGAIALADGAFVDAALVRSAQQTVAHAARYGTRSPSR
jgi:citrate lyase subunit beta / citryl-CoA lyase